MPADVHAPTAVRLVPVDAPEVLAVVAYTDHDVRVRYHPDKRTRWRCTDCGPQATPTCPHARAVDLTTQALDVLTRNATTDYLTGDPR